MSIGHLYMLLALLCFGALGVLSKLADRTDCRPTAIGPMVYLWATALVALSVFVLGRLSRSKLHKILTQGELRPHKVRYYVERRESHHVARDPREHQTGTR